MKSECEHPVLAWGHLEGLPVKTFGWFLSTLIFVCIFPAKLQLIDVRAPSSRILNIRTHMSSPAMVALDEVQLGLELVSPETAENLKGYGAITLNSGKVWDPQPVVPSREPPKRIDLDKPSNELQHLRGIRVSSSNDIAELHATDSSGDWESRAKALVDAALKDMQDEPAEVQIPTHGGGQIIVRSTEATHGKKPTLVEGAKPQPKRGDSIGDLVDTNYNGNRFSLSGHLILAGQLESSDQVSIYHVVNGRTLVKGSFWEPDLRYEIEVTGRKGHLLAEIRRADGRLKYEGELSLAQVNLDSWSQIKIGSLPIRLHTPAQDHFQILVESGYSFSGNQRAVADSKVHLLPFDAEIDKLNDLEFEERDVYVGSTAIVEASAPNHWPTRAMVVAGVKAKIKLFHNNLVKAFLELIEMKNSENENPPAMIWGIVRKNGKPVSGAQVEVESFQNGVLSYFRYNLPTLKEMSTDSSGQFVWAGSSSDRVSLRVHYRGQQYPGQVISAESGAVFWVDIDFNEMDARTVTIENVFDIPGSGRSSSSLRMLGSEKILDNIVGGVDVNFQTGNGTFFTELDPGREFFISRLQSPISDKTLQHFLVNQSWVTQLKARLNMNDSPSSSLIFGVLDSANEVFLYGEYGDVLEKPVFLDASGRVVKTESEAAAYFYFNLDPGRYTLVEMFDSQQKLNIQIMDVDEGYMSVKRLVQ